MSLVPHNIVSRQEAIASLTGGARVQLVRGGEFLVGSGVAVAFLRPEALRFQTPTTIEWTPAGLKEQPPWLPWAPGTPIPPYHLLIERPSGYFYVGEAHLATFATDGSRATFHLRRALPRDAWVTFGGYPHWLVELNHERHLLGPDAVGPLRALLRRVVARPYGHLCLTRYEEDALHLHTNRKRGWLMYLREPADAGLYVRARDEDDGEEERFMCDCGIDLEFPRSRTLPVAEAAELVVEFFRSGKLPTSVTWEPQ